MKISVCLAFFKKKRKKRNRPYTPALFQKMLNLYTKLDGLVLTHHPDMSLRNYLMWQYKQVNKGDTNQRIIKFIKKILLSHEWSGWRGSSRMDGLISVSVTHMVLPLTNVRVFLHSRTTLTCVCLLVWDLCFLLEHGAEGTPQGKLWFTVGTEDSPINHFLWLECHDFSPKWTTSCLWLTEMTKNYVSKTLRQPQQSCFFSVLQATFCNEILKCRAEN